MGTASEVSKRIQNSYSIEPPKRPSVFSALLAVARGVAEVLAVTPGTGDDVAGSIRENSAEGSIEGEWASGADGHTEPRLPEPPPI